MQQQVGIITMYTFEQINKYSKHYTSFQNTLASPKIHNAVNMHKNYKYRSIRLFVSESPCL